MFTQENTFERIKEILDSQLFGVLATSGASYPYCTIVGFAPSKDYRKIVFATIRETRKYKNINNKSSVSLLIDDRTNNTIDLHDAIALTILGNAFEVNNECKDYQSLLLRKHPYLREFVVSPNCAIIEVKVDKYILVSKFQNVIELELS